MDGIGKKLANRRHILCIPINTELTGVQTGLWYPLFRPRRTIRFFSIWQFSKKKSNLLSTMLAAAFILRKPFRRKFRLSFGIVS